MPGPHSQPKPGKTRRKREKIAGVPYRGRERHDPAHDPAGNPLPHPQRER